MKCQDPDVILYGAKMYAPPTHEALLSRLHERGWRDLWGVKEGNVVLTPGPLDFLAHHGPSFIREVLPWLGEHLAAMQRA